MLIGFTGDVSFSGFFSQKEDVDFVDERIINRLRDNDFNIFNLEGPLSNSEPLPQKGSTMGSPTKIKLLNKLGCNVFNLANNHIMDAGIQGFFDTKTIAEDNSILFFGAGENLEVASKPLFVRKNEVSVSIIGVSHQEGLLASESGPGVFSDKHRAKIRERISECKNNTDWVILCYHGGEEFTFCPSPSRRDKLTSFIEDGADLVIAHHSHTVQGYEIYRGGAIFYSLGNFVFDTPYQRINPGTTQSAILMVEFSKTKFEVEAIFSEIDRMDEKVLLLDNNQQFREFNDENHAKEWAEDCGRYYKSLIAKVKCSPIISNPQRKIAFLNKLFFLRRFLVGMKIIFIFLRSLIKKGSQREISIGFLRYKLEKIFSKTYF